jgi:hypothetical protein
MVAVVAVVKVVVLVADVAIMVVVALAIAEVLLESTVQVQGVWNGGKSAWSMPGVHWALHSAHHSFFS